MKDIRTIRRTVATMVNRLHKLGYSLSQAFKTAWKRIKEGMTVKAAGVTYGNIIKGRMHPRFWKNVYKI